MTRREFREEEFKLLFTVNFYPPEELTAQTEQYLEEEELPEGSDPEVFRAFLQDIAGKLDVINEEITAVAEGWRPARMNKVDLTVIRLAVYEIKYCEEIPVKVSLNEAVELAKKYGGDESPKFVNGVLANYVKHFEIAAD